MIRQGLVCILVGFSISVEAEENPAFQAKIANIIGYQVEKSLSIESICGENDMQYVNSYDGTLGVTREFVHEMKGSVGALANEKNRKYCSGTLVQEDLFLTASHCIDSSVTRDHISFEYEFEEDSSDLKKEVNFEILEVVEDGASEGFDYAVLRLAGAPGAQFGWKQLNLEKLDAQQLAIIQHPKGEPKQIEAGVDFKIRRSKIYYGDLDTEAGSSGSGVIDDNGFVVGVHTHGGCRRNNGANSGTYLSIASETSPLLQSLQREER